MNSLNSWRKAITEMTEQNNIDTSPAALCAVAEQYAKTSTVPANFSAVLRAVAAEKEAQQPTDDQRKLLNYAWRCLEEEAEECDRRGNALVATRVRESANALGNLLMAQPKPAPQHHKGQHLNMVAPADVPLPEPNPASAAYPGLTDHQLHQYAEAYANAKVAAERERCAKLCDLHSRLTWNDDRKTQSRVLAAEIRRVEIQVDQKGAV